ncbi:unnamed protein product [Camellia sinensis]
MVNQLAKGLRYERKERKIRPSVSCSVITSDNGKETLRTDTTTHFNIMTSRSFRGSESLQGKSIPMSVKFARRTSSGRYVDYSRESNDLDSDIGSGEEIEICKEDFIRPIH